MDLKKGDILDFILKRIDSQSGYAANKDRKNFVAAWNWAEAVRRIETDSGR